METNSFWTLRLPQFHQNWLHVSVSFSSLFSESCVDKCLICREHAKIFKAEDMQQSIEGKNCIVTGANSGIGYATAEALASRYLVYL